MLKRPRNTINYQKMRSHMPSSLMGPVALWENIRGGRLLYGVLHDKSQKLLKEKDLALGLVELHKVRTGRLLKPIKVPLDGIPSLKRINRTTQLGVICKFAEGALSPTIYVIDEDIEQYWSQYRPLRDTTRYWFPFGH
ncbi:hypothetical protein GRJ2_003426900 [Grus japonensis]|uniref:Uncharacterized protein n=1 Tax=Grus japonensis TaxID=30415 RepID=A0ABC9YJ48_GRUJA